MYKISLTRLKLKLFLSGFVDIIKLLTIQTLQKNSIERMMNNGTKLQLIKLINFSISLLATTCTGEAES